MARMVFTRTNDTTIRVLIAGSIAGGLVSAALYNPGNPDYLYIGLGFFVPFLAILPLAYFVKSYRASCSGCGADLSNFCAGPSEPGLIHCPACGKKFDGGS